MAVHGRAKPVCQIIDHGAVLLLIAGTYAPFTLGPLRGAWGWTLSILVWGLAAVGVVFKAARGMRHPRVSLVLYLSMGWLMIVAVRPLWQRVPWPGLARLT